jgi:hypothetical protein
VEKLKYFTKMALLDIPIKPYRCSGRAAMPMINCYIAVLIKSESILLIANIIYLHIEIITGGCEALV